MWLVLCICMSAAAGAGKVLNSHGVWCLLRWGGGYVMWLAFA